MLIIAVIIINLLKQGNGKINGGEGIISLSNKLLILFATNNIVFVKN